MKRALPFVALVLTAALVPVRLCAAGAGDWFRGDPPPAFERGVAEIIERPLSRRDFPTRSPVLDGEWLFATYMMAAMGFGQVALEHPERRADELPRMEACIAKLISKPVRAFDTEAWGDDPLAHLDEDRADHGSYLGYLDLVLSLDRLLDPQTRYARLNDQITATLARRLERHPLLASYEKSYFPVDNTAVIAAIALYDRATHSDAHRILIARFSTRLRTEWIDPRTGLLHQTEPHGRARGSGTALAAYFLSYADRELSSELFAAACRQLYGSVLGFGAVREYPRGKTGSGDADSGPLVMGFGVSATGFLLGAARAHGDAERFRHLYATVELFGAPEEHGGIRRYTAGGPVGNAILFAMLTAPRSLP